MAGGGGKKKRKKQAKFNENEVEFIAGLVYGNLARRYDFKINIADCQRLVYEGMRRLHKPSGFERDVLAEIEKLVDGG